MVPIGFLKNFPKGLGEGRIGARWGITTSYMTPPTNYSYITPPTNSAHTNRLLLILKSIEKTL